MFSELILTRKRKTRNKVYSLHAPKMECIAKGKAPEALQARLEHSTSPQGALIAS